MKHSTIIYGFLTILGLVFLEPFLSSLLKGFIDSGLLMMVTFLSIVGTVFLIAGLCGIISRYFKNSQKLSSLQSKLGRKLMVKSSRIFRFLAVLGIAFLVALPAFWFWSSHSAEVMRFFMDTPLAGFLLYFVFLFGGISLLTVGICGIERQYLKNNQNLFTILTAISIPSFILLPLVYMVISAITVGI